MRKGFRRGETRDFLFLGEGPVDGDFVFEACFGVEVVDFFVGGAVLVEPECGFDVVAAVFGDLFGFALFPPFEGFESGGGFVDAE